ncbi:uncharacterized protein [Dysidea avara]|uniref:uncharacterized protein n=1 Tax=Dysidea avara TaxID=196820 RepID=UPI00332DB111
MEGGNDIILDDNINITHDESEHQESGNTPRERINSQDFETVERDETGYAVDLCNKWIIQPYRVCLRGMGWYELVTDPSPVMKLLRWIWVLFISMVITATLITQILSCFRRDQFESELVPVTSGNHTVEVIRCNVSVVSNSIIPDLLLLTTYFYGIYLFWSGQEYLQNLAGQVFVQCYKFTAWPDPTSRRLINTIFFYLILGVAYIVVSLAVRIADAAVFDLFDGNVTVSWPDGGPQFSGGGKLVLVIFSLFGFIFFDAVYIMAIINYAIQSELNIYLLSALRIKVERREHKSLDDAVKDINRANNYLKVLNGKTATAVALIMFNVATAALNGLIVLQDNNNSTDRTVVATITAVLWSLLVVFPFIQAARVTAACNGLLASGPIIRGRPLQYMGSPQLELDSFSIFTLSITMRAEIFGIPVYPWMAYLCAVAFSFTLLLLCQTGDYDYAEWL